MEPAISYAEQGFAVSPQVSRAWKEAFADYSVHCQGEEFKPWFATFCPQGRAPEAGEIVRLPDHAKTLRRIAETGAEAFYQGELAEQIEAFSKAFKGWLRADDLAEFHNQWVEPISTRYRGYDVWEIPPNGDGITVLMALNILSGFDFQGAREYAPYYHAAIEALKLAFIDTQNYVTEPACMPYSVEDLLSASYAAERRKLIGREAIDPQPGKPSKGGTVYIAAADGEGNMVSFIQSNYNDFGSGIVIPGTGIALQNRGSEFKLDPKHPNVLAPRKRTFHTIIPGFLTKDGEALGPFGVMGAYMQPQGHLQVISNMLDFGMNPQEALDAPRWQWTGGKHVQLEQGVPNQLALDLAARGHEVEIVHDRGSMGRGEIIFRTGDGSLVGATEPRTDGCVAAW
jgi:gamma-glutamyltranspeptidase/glutathione hydrolase